MQVFSTTDGRFRPVACLAAPGLKHGMACLDVWDGGIKAILGNADINEAWVLDIAGGAPAVQLKGEKKACFALLSLNNYGLVRVSRASFSPMLM